MGDPRGTSSQQIQTENNHQLGLRLRPFQLREVTFLQDLKRAGIAWDMGLGKTACASILGATKHLNRWLIICPDNAFSTWHHEAPRWIHTVWPEVYIHTIFVTGSNRDDIWNSQLQPKPNTI